jgi:DNA-binding NarL/FixJ family response regulator
MASDVLAPALRPEQGAPMAASFGGRVLLVEDEEFTRSLLLDGLHRLGVEARGAATIAEALDLMAEFDPHVVISDLNLGAGPSGAALLSRISQERPWIGLVALTAHSSPELASSDGRTLPDTVVYVVKSTLESVADLLPFASAAIGNVRMDSTPPATDQRVLTSTQADILRLIAEGYSNAGIANVRGISLRAAESQVVRIFSALGIESDPLTNPRVKAVRMWQQGHVVVR